MESLVAFSLAASIFQVVLFGLSVLSSTKTLYQKGHSTPSDIIDIEMIAKDLELRVKYLQASAVLEGPNADKSVMALYETCLSISTELSEIINKIGTGSKGKKWTSLKQAMPTIRSKDEIEKLVKRLTDIRSDVHFYLAVTMRGETAEQTRMLSELDRRVAQMCRYIQQKPTELGYSWETGKREDQLRVDDGLGPGYYLPVSLCETPQALYDLLRQKFKSRNLPGLLQAEAGHILFLEWNERHEVTRGNWLAVVKGDRALKLSFVMGNWHGPPRGRCLRCRKPRNRNASQSPFKTCPSCKLSVRWVDPNYLPFEPEDTNLDKDSFRNYKIASRTPNIQNFPEPRSVSFVRERLQRKNAVPDIDFVCHRLTMKWEPMWNLTFRYIFCRCVILLSTPSRINKEKTILKSSLCPRHNNLGKTSRDYSELAVPCREDPYFSQFGGYSAFWAFLCCYYPEIYENINGSSAISQNELIHGYVDLFDKQKQDAGAIPSLISEYNAELGHPCSGDDDRGHEKKSHFMDIKFTEEILEQFKAAFAKSSIVKELEKVLDGNWDGVPHWIIENY